MLAETRMMHNVTLNGRPLDRSTGERHTPAIQTMKTLLAVLLFAAAAFTSSAAETNAVSPSIAKDSRCFEMRTYFAMPGKLEDLNKRFRDHTCRLFQKHGIELIGFWIPQDKDKGADTKLIYILAHKSRDAAKKSYASFGADPEWKKVVGESEANGKLVEKIESVFLRIWLQKFILAKNMKKKLIALAYMLRPGLTIPILCTCVIIVVICSEKLQFFNILKISHNSFKY